jgi:hypothetical protein
MQCRGTPAGERLRIRRGVFTGANDVLLLRDVEPRIGGLASIRADGAHHAVGARGAAASGTSRAVTDTRARDFEALVEACAIRPLLRGSDLSAFNFRIARHVLWVHGNGGAATGAPPRLQKYLDRHRVRLQSRTGLRPGAHEGQLFRVTPELLGPKVAWHDLAETLHAVALPATFASPLGRLPVVPLNTVYFIAAADDTQALRLAALLNSLPVRVFARSIAERAKDARMRFFAWTIGVLPLPPDWERAPGLLSISREAHAAGGLDDERARALNDCVAGLYALADSDMNALAEFDAWLSGRTT